MKDGSDEQKMQKLYSYVNKYGTYTPSSWWHHLVLPYNKINMKTTIRTPYTVNAVFLLLIALGAVAFFGTYQYSHASSIDCRQAFNY